MRVALDNQLPSPPYNKSLLLELHEMFAYPR